MRIKKTVERWFEVPNDLDKGELCIRHLQPGETADIFDKVFTQEIKYKKKGKKFEPDFLQVTNKKLDRELTLTTVVVGWKNFFDREGKSLECTPDNIIRASREIEDFNELVTELREKLAKDIKQEEEDQRKNSSGSASEPAK